MLMFCNWGLSEFKDNEIPFLVIIKKDFKQEFFDSLKSINYDIKKIKPVKEFNSKYKNSELYIIPEFDSEYSHIQDVLNKSKSNPKFNVVPYTNFPEAFNPPYKK